MCATKLICPPLQGLMLMDGWYLRNMSCIQKNELSVSPGWEGFNQRWDFYRGEYYTFLERSECIKCEPANLGSPPPRISHTII